MGDASTVATESYANIRTVRAFSSEWLEEKKYDLNQSIGEAHGHLQSSSLVGMRRSRRWMAVYVAALRKGLKESFGGALQNLLSSYTNLAAGIMILWYGGIVVLNDGPLSVGNLITFRELTFRAHADAQHSLPSPPLSGRRVCLHRALLEHDPWQLCVCTSASRSTGCGPLTLHRCCFTDQAINNLVVQFTTARGAAQRVFEMLDALPDVDLNAGVKLNRAELRGTIDLDHVTFAYQMRPKEKVINDVSLTIDGGSTVAFVGKSGGGKSTIVHLLMRFYDPSSGRILLDGRDLKDINLRSLHEMTGLVAQDTQLFGSECSNGRLGLRLLPRL